VPVPPKVFISYTHESNEHADRVLNLANRLRKDGLDADVDQYHHSPEEGWPRWTEERIRWADFVYVIATSTYLARILGTEKPGTGLGVRWEGHLIYQHVYNAGANNQKFIPVIFVESDKEFIPTPLQGSTHYCLAEPNNDYSNLLKRSLGIPLNVKPPLGKLDSLDEKERKTDVGMFFTTFINLSLWEKVRWAGCVYLHDEQLKEPPMLGLLFRDKAAAEQIFKEWRERLGQFDTYNELRISIVEGNISGKPAGGYSVHIGSNIENIYKRADADGIDIPRDRVMMLSRLHYMTPVKGSMNLSVFRRRYEQFGSYLLVPVLQKGSEFTPGIGLAIHKRDIEFRRVSEISKNDPDACVIPEFLTRKENAEN
jgi:SEFIR domain